MGSFGRILRPIFDPGLAVAPPWWQVAGKTCVAAYQPKGAASLAASYVNLANPGTYDAAPGAAPTWASATGWTFNGTQYLVVAGLVQNRPLTMLVSASQSSSDGGGLLWTADATKNKGVAIGIGTTFDTADNVVSALSATIAWLSSTSTVNIAGFVIGIALGNGANNVSAPYVLYLDGNPVKSGNVAVFDTATDFNIAAIGVRGVSATIKSVVIYSSTLTAGEVATVSAAMAAL